MTYTDSGVIVLGVIVLIIGFVIVSGYYDARDRARQQSQEGLFGSFEALGIMIEWMSNAFQLMIFNLFVTGAALIAAGLGIRSMKTKESG